MGTFIRVISKRLLTYFLEQANTKHHSCALNTLTRTECFCKNLFRFFNNHPPKFLSLGNELLQSYILSSCLMMNSLHSPRYRAFSYPVPPSHLPSLSLPPLSLYT